MGTPESAAPSVQSMVSIESMSSLCVGPVAGLFMRIPSVWGFFPLCPLSGLLVMSTIHTEKTTNILAACFVQVAG